MSWRPSAAHCSSEAMSSVLMLGMASYRVRSTIPVAAACASGWAIGVVTGAGVDCWAGFGVGC